MAERQVLGACMNLRDGKPCGAPAAYRRFDWLLCLACHQGNRHLSVTCSLVPWGDKESHK